MVLKNLTFKQSFFSEHLADTLKDLKKTWFSWEKKMKWWIVIFTNNIKAEHQNTEETQVHCNEEGSNVKVITFLKWKEKTINKL